MNTTVHEHHEKNPLCAPPYLALKHPPEAPALHRADDRCAVSTARATVAAIREPVRPCVGPGSRDFELLSSGLAARGERSEPEDFRINFSLFLGFFVNEHKRTFMNRACS